MENTGKLRLLLLLQILKEQTDEDNYLTTTQLCDILRAQYGIEAHRITVKNDIETLQRAGFGIDERRSTQNRYRYLEREFDTAELKTIIDAIASSKFITERKSEALIQKVTALTGKNKASELKRNVVVDGRRKLDNEQIFYIIDAVNEAINRRRKIAFQKISYNERKERVLHNEGETYIFSPYSLVWDGDNYYAIGYSEKYGNIGSHRVDRIAATPTILDEPAEPQPENFDAAAFVNTAFRMYNSPCKAVTLQCDNSVMAAIIDCFGIDVAVRKSSAGTFTVKVNVSVSHVFFSWIFGFGGKVRIKAPAAVKAQYREMVLGALEKL